MVRLASGCALRCAVVVIAIALAARGTVAEEGARMRAPAAVGYLEGSVRLGPMCPVERAEAPCPVPPEAYAAREILLKKEGEVVARARPDSQGRYRLSVPPGKYVVDINHVGVDASGDVPSEVEVRAGEAARMDIAIDTGMR
jgi:hypothetical protein